MSITHADVEKVAHLAHLGITQEEALAYSQQLSNILQLLDELNKVDTTNIETMSHPIDGISQRLRPDVVTETNQLAVLQSVSPVPTVEHLYLVPQVIE
jgi:aspartyl-tRNA(Asn)/glutamyl-tRNA(Gln) amidotransferase subunit C